MFSHIVRYLALALLISFSSSAQEEPGQGLPTLLRTNEHFGMRLLELVSSEKPDRNVVISPLSLTLILGALQSNLDWPLRAEIASAFGWSEYPHLDVPARMLLVAFEEPTAALVEPKRGLPAQAFPKPSREAAWITNSFLYADKNKG